MDGTLIASRTAPAYGAAKRGATLAGRWLGNFLFPPQCPFTGERVSRHGTIHPRGWALLRHLGPPWCPACGVPFVEPQPEAVLCGACAAPSRHDRNLTGRYLTRIRAALGYDDVVASAILSLKYGDRHDGVAAFAALMATAGAELLAVPGAVLVPVPLHPSRLRARRYNQAQLLASALSVRTGVTMAHALVRHRATPSQRGASPQQRMRNVRGAFDVADPKTISGRHVILVDDVLTTGATLQSCARPLLKAGAGSVSAVTLARILKDTATGGISPWSEDGVTQ